MKKLHPSPFTHLASLVKNRQAETAADREREAAERETAARSRQFAELTGQPVAATPELILRGIAIAEGRIQTFDPPVQPEPQRPRTPEERQATVAAIVAAYNRATGKP